MTPIDPACSRNLKPPAKAENSIIDFRHFQWLAVI